MIIDKYLLMNYFDLVKNDNNVEIALELCNKLGIRLDKEDFLSINACKKKNEFNGVVIPSIIIRSNKWEMEINILDDRYITTKGWKQNEYQFVRQISYIDNEIIEEAFSLDIDGEKYIALNQSDTYKAVCLDSDEKSIIRIHQDSKSRSMLDDSIEEIKCFSNEVTTTEVSFFNEVVYFENDEDLYDVTIDKKEDQLFLAGATLNIPEFSITGSRYTEDILVYEQLGIIRTENDEENVYNPPTIFIYGEHLKNEEIVKYVVKITKYAEEISVTFGENENSKKFKLVDRDVGPISIQDLELIIDNLFVLLDTKEYRNLVVGYLTDIKNRLDFRQDHDLEEIDSYNNDQVDRLLNDKSETIEQQGFNIYLNKEHIKEVFENADIPSIDVNNSLIL